MAARVYPNINQHPEAHTDIFKRTLAPFPPSPCTHTTTRIEEDHPSDDEIIAALGDDATIIINKEIPITAALIGRFPPTMKLICEAGTGFNNIALDAAAARGIKVTNVPAYSTEAVAQLVATFLLNFSCSLGLQQRMLQNGDKSNFKGLLLKFRTPLAQDI